MKQTDPPEKDDFPVSFMFVDSLIFLKEEGSDLYRYALLSEGRIKKYYTDPMPLEDVKKWAQDHYIASVRNSIQRRCLTYNQDKEETNGRT